MLLYGCWIYIIILQQGVGWVHYFMCQCRKLSTALFSGPVVRSAFVHMRTLCMHLCFCTFFEVHIFTAFKIFCCRILGGGLISTIRSCNPKICFPNESDYLMFVRWRKIERFLTPCLISRRKLLFS